MQAPEREPVIVGAVRTPVGRRNGGLAGLHAVDLGAAALRALVDRSGVDPDRVDDVIMGCVSQTGEQAVNVARNAWLAAGLPEEGIAPGTRWEDVPMNWTCPECGARKDDFEMMEL